MKDQRPTSPEVQKSDAPDFALRPKSIDQFIGQTEIVENIKIYIEAAKGRNEPLDHILFYGPPGLGKTTLAYIIAREMGVNIKAIQAPMLEKTGDIAAYLTTLSPNDVFFIDEIHRLKIAIEEVLYNAMEDFKLDIIIGQGAGAKSIKIQLPRFTLIGATTKAGLLSAPLYERFGIVNRLNLYDEKLLHKIVLRTAQMMKIEIEDQAAGEIARRSRGTPRVVNRIMRRIRDFAQIQGDNVINLEIARYALEKLDIDPLGLDANDRRLLNTLITHYQGGPVGLDTLAVSLGETSDTIEDVLEPYLIQMGFLARTPRGRVATSLAYKHIGIEPPQSTGDLFSHNPDQENPK